MNITITVKTTPVGCRPTTTAVPCAGLSPDALKNTICRAVTAVHRMTEIDSTPRALVIEITSDPLADVCIRMTQENLAPPTE